MSDELRVLLVTAASIGLVHTLLGPDHYVPFIALAGTQKWKLTKTMVVTLLCGVGHVAGSVLLGMIGISLGIASRALEVVESIRGDIAAWTLISFGLVYFIWGLRRAFRKNPGAHKHLHLFGVKHDHGNGTPAVHDHGHIHDHQKPSVTPWVLFIIFVFGPCEPLIPILMYPAAMDRFSNVLLVAGVFSVVTIATMMSIVVLSTLGISLLDLRRFEKYTHAIAGATILACGLAIVFLGV